jgi:hypothetical protein
MNNEEAKRLLRDHLQAYRFRRVDRRSLLHLSVPKSDSGIVLAKAVGAKK